MSTTTETELHEDRTHALPTKKFSFGRVHVGTSSFYNARAKRATDVLLAIIALPSVTLCAVVLLLINPFANPGPLFFQQRRTGQNGKPFIIYKFRTMYHDLSDHQANKLVTKDDERVTPLGRFLRRTSMDELPQLFNVLRGDMSIVGPRPHAEAAKAGGRLYHQVVDQYATRHKVKPGITGWAQVNGWRGETNAEVDIRKRVEHDLYYIDHWSIWLDFVIIARTIMVLLGKDEKAY